MVFKVFVLRINKMKGGYTLLVREDMVGLIQSLLIIMCLKSILLQVVVT